MKRQIITIEDGALVIREVECDVKVSPSFNMHMYYNTNVNTEFANDIGRETNPLTLNDMYTNIHTRVETLINKINEDFEILEG